MGGACGTLGEQERCLQGFGRGDIMERDSVEDLGVNGNIVLRDRRYTYNLTLRSFRLTIVVMEKQKGIKCHECVFLALVIQPTKCMRLVILSVACLAVPHLRTLSRKRHYFRGKVIEQNTCAFMLSRTLSETFLILRRVQRHAIINVYSYSCEVPVTCQILMKLKIFATGFGKILKYIRVT